MFLVENQWERFLDQEGKTVLLTLPVKSRARFQLSDLKRGSITSVINVRPLGPA